MSISTEAIVARCLHDAREKKIQALVGTLEDIASSGPEKKPKAQPGADENVMLAYEDGHADASFDLAEKARAALLAWELPL